MEILDAGRAYAGGHPSWRAHVPLYQKSGDIERARRLSNPDLSPHLSFIDMGGHGRTKLRVTSETRWNASSRVYTASAGTQR